MTLFLYKCVQPQVYEAINDINEGVGSKAFDALSHHPSLYYGHHDAYRNLIKSCADGRWLILAEDTVHNTLMPPRPLSVQGMSLTMWNHSLYVHESPTRDDEV